MADSRAQLGTVLKLLTSLPLEGSLSEMLCAGLPHALELTNQERHPMASTVLAMAKEVLAGAQTESQDTEATSKAEVDAAQADLNACQAAVASASESLAAAQAAVGERKEALGESKNGVSREEHEHKRAEADEKSRAKVAARLEKRRREVATLTAQLGVKGSANAIETWLEEAKADPVLIASVSPVLEKEPADRVGFDLTVISALQTFLKERAASLDKEVEREAENQADAHATAVGAFAILDLARDAVKDAAQRLKDAEADVEAARVSLDEAKIAVNRQETVVSKKRVACTVAEEKVKRTRRGLEFFTHLETGKTVEEPATEEVAAAAADAVPSAPQTGIAVS